MKVTLITSFVSLFLATQLVSGQADDAACIISDYDTSDPVAAKQEQLNEFTVSDAGTQETSQFGAKINNSDSLKAGLDGPTLMEDFMLREKIMHFGKYILQLCIYFIQLTCNFLYRS